MIAIVLIVIILVVVSRYDDPILVSAYDDLIPDYDDLIPDHDDLIPDQVVLYTRNKDNHDTRNSISFKSTNHNLLKWLCILPSSSSPSSILTLSPSLSSQSSSSSQSSISLCKYDSNSVIYHKQQYYKRIQQTKRMSRQQSSSSSSSPSPSSMQLPSKKVKLSIILDFDGIRNRMSNSNSNDNDDSDDSNDNGIINDTSSDDDNIISIIGNAPINNNMIPIGNIYNNYKSVLISFIKGNSININSNSGNMITYYNDDNSNSISNNNGNMISYYNDNIQRLPVLFNDIVAADTYYVSVSHVKESSLAFYNSYTNDSSNTIVVVLSSVLLLVIVYISGALTVLLFQSIYTTTSSNNTDVDESIQQFEKKALVALETGDIGQVREIVAQAVEYINENKNQSALDVAAFKHILGRAENIGRNFDRAEPLLKEVKELYEDCDTDDLYGTVLEDYADSLRGQGRTDEAIESMHMAAAVFDEITVMEDYLSNDQVISSSSPIPAPQHVEEATKSMSPGSKELSDYLDSFSNIYNTNTTNNVFGSNISSTNNINVSKGSNGSRNSSSSSSISSSSPAKPTYRHHLIRCTSKQNKKASSPSDLDDFYDIDDDDSENINPNIANTNANTSITYSIKPNSNPILKPKLKPKRPLHLSSPSSSFFHNTDKTVLSPKTPMSKQPPKKDVVILASPATLASSTPAPSSTLSSTPAPSSTLSSTPAPSSTLSSTPAPSSKLSSTSAVKSPFDTTKDLCLSVSTNSVRVRSNIGKMMMEEHRYSDANDIFNSVLETCKFLSNQNIDVENIIKDVTQWKSQIIAHTHNVVRIDNDDDD